MRNGFNGELTARRTALATSKQELESIYGETMGSDEVVRSNKDLVEKISKALLVADAAFTSLNGTIKSIKIAVDSCHTKSNMQNSMCFIFEMDWSTLRRSLQCMMQLRLHMHSSL